MNKFEPKRRPTSIEDDFALWTAEQGALLRAGTLDRIDRDNLAEEIESLGRSEKYEIESRLKVLLLHLLKWQFQSGKRSNSWRATIDEQRGRIRRRLKDSPSLVNYPAEILQEEYSYARPFAADETGLDEGLFPEVCPYSAEQVLDPAFFPEPR